MLHVTCDLCGKEIRPGDDHRYVVKIEVYSANDPAEITEADLEEDHMEAVSQMLQDVEARRQTEIDYLNGGIVRFGQELGVPTPLNEAITALVKGVERSWA